MASPQEREVLTALKEMAQKVLAVLDEIPAPPETVAMSVPEWWEEVFETAMPTRQRETAIIQQEAQALTAAPQLIRDLLAAIAKAESAPPVVHEPGCDSRFCSACDWLASAHPLRASTSAGVTCETFTASQCNCKAQLASSVAAAPASDEKLLAIAGLVNGYHNDSTRLTAAETLAAIADVLGEPLAHAEWTPDQLAALRDLADAVQKAHARSLRAGEDQKGSQ